MKCEACRAFYCFFPTSFINSIIQGHTVKPVFSGHSKIDKTKVLMENGNLLKVESIAECPLGSFCNTFDLH